MKKLIVDDKIVLIPMTSQLYHIERKNYNYIVKKDNKGYENI